MFWLVKPFWLYRLYSSFQVELGGFFYSVLLSETFSSGICHIRATTTTRFCTSALLWLFSNTCQTTLRNLKTETTFQITLPFSFSWSKQRWPTFEFLCTTICKKLTCHADIQISIYYPWLWEWDKEVCWATLFCPSVWLSALANGASEEVDEYIH